MEEGNTERLNFIPCIKWVRRGVAKENPETVQLSKEELEEVIKEAKSKLTETETNEDDEDDSDEEGKEQEVEMNTETETGQDEFNFDKYDEEGDGNALGIDSAVEMGNHEDVAFSDSDSEKEDEIIKPNDNLVLVGHIEGDASILEVYVYNEEEGSLYVHHDFILPSIPLCLEWLDYEPGQSAPGNLCAVGTMSPVIEVWDLDIVNCLEAAFKLGQPGSRKKKIKHVGHFDAVLDLAWNKNYHHILGSASVDKTVLLWDLDAGTPHTKLNVFKDKVQCIKWHSLESQTLLTGSCDKTARVFDCRTDNTHQSWDLDGEAERVIWDPLEPFCFMAGTSAGSIQCFDCRKGMLWTHEAHEKEVTGLVISNRCKGLMVSASGDGTIKTWDYTYNNIPELIHTKESKLGIIHCLELNPDLPFVIGAGGDNRNHNFQVLDLRTNDPVNHRFGSRPLVEIVESNTSSTVKLEEMECLSINK